MAGVLQPIQQHDLDQAPHVQRAGGGIEADVAGDDLARSGASILEVRSLVDEAALVEHAQEIGLVGRHDEDPATEGSGQGKEARSIADRGGAFHLADAARPRSAWLCAGDMRLYTHPGRMFQPLEATREAGRGRRRQETAAPGQIASVTGADSATVQVLFAATVAHWRASGGRRPARGTRWTSRSDLYRRRSAGHRLGRAFQIYFDDTAPGVMCDLDASGVEAACAGLLGQLTKCDVVVLGKFGKLEAAQIGFDHRISRR
ncbi:MAG: DUF2478 domain-containing protein [Steroidobacteraceae bacterium]